jgi:hypothetical protein
LKIILRVVLSTIPHRAYPQETKRIKGVIHHLSTGRLLL